MVTLKRLCLSLCFVTTLYSVGAQNAATNAAANQNVSSIGANLNDSDDYYYLTTATTFLNVDDFATGTETDVWHYLIGKIQGLNITIEGESAYGIMAIKTRGGPSAMGDKSNLLWVVDGLYQPCGDIISALNPNDIESIRVLRDAAAIAPYGEAGANGVVIIKTRHPSDGKTIVSYDGNVSMNTYDSNYDNNNTSYSTKHNASLAGSVANVPYRVSLGYNIVNSVWDNVGNDRASGNLWIGPRLLDNHLRIDFNGYGRHIYSSLVNIEQKERYLIGNATIDYAVHSLESLHVKLAAGLNNYNTELIGADYSDDYSGTDKTLDANINYNHRFGEKGYFESKIGMSLWDNQLDETAFYAQLYTNISRVFFSANARYSSIDQEFGSNQKRLSASYSMGVKPIDAFKVRAGIGLLGLNAGEKTTRKYSDNAVGKTMAINFGADFDFANNRIYGSVDLYFNHNYDEVPNYVEESAGYFSHRNTKGKPLSLDNSGVEFLLNAKVIDNKNVKWLIRTTFAANKYDVGYEKDGEWVLQQTEDNLLLLAEDGGKPLTFFVPEKVYRKDGSDFPGLYRDLDGDGAITERDYVGYHSPIPTVTGGFSTCLDVRGAYLQINGHTQIGRYNILSVSTPTSEYIQNSSFLRIDDVVLGYNFGGSNYLSGKIYVAANNLMIFTKSESHDPELIVGYDQGYNFCRPNIFSLGLKLNINMKD